MSTWVFVMVLLLPSFGGSVTATIQTTSYESCKKLRRVVVSQFGGEHNINGTVSDCTALKPQT